MRNIAKGKEMNGEKSWLTCKEAGELLNFSQRHILNLIKKGKLKAEKDYDGKFFIDKADFFRSYPHAMGKEDPGTIEFQLEQSSTKFLEEKIKHLQEMVNEKKKQNEFLTEQLGNFTEEKSKMLDAINSHTRLLEYKEAGHPTRKKKSKWWPFKKN